MEEPLAKPASQTHKQNYFVLIFRGEFLCPQKSCNFDTYTQYTVHHDLSNVRNYSGIPLFHGDNINKILLF